MILFIVKNSIRDLAEHIHISANEAIEAYRSSLGDRLQLIVDEVLAPFDQHVYSIQTGFKIVGDNSVVAYLVANETNKNPNLFVINEEFKLFADVLRQRLQSCKVFTYGGGFSFPTFQETYVRDIEVNEYTDESAKLSSSSDSYLTNLNYHTKIP